MTLLGAKVGTAEMERAEQIRNVVWKQNGQERIYRMEEVINNQRERKKKEKEGKDGRKKGRKSVEELGDSSPR